MSSDDQDFTTTELRLMREKNDLEDRLLNDLLVAQHDISELTLQNLHQDTDIKELKKKITQLQKEVENLQKDKIKSDSRIKALEKSVETVMKNVEAHKKLRKRLDELEDYVIGEDENYKPKVSPQHPQQPRIAMEFSRLMHKYFAVLLGSRNTEVRLIQYTKRFDTIEERVISSLGDDEKQKKTIREKFNDLPSEIFEPWFSDFLVSTGCPKLLCSTYKATVAKINSSGHDVGVKEDALKVIDCLRGMYKKLEEPFGGIQSTQDRVASPSRSKRRTKSPARGANSQRKQAKTQ